MMITKEDIMVEFEEYKMASDAIPNHVGEYFVRFMSLDEYNKLMGGSILLNNTNHASHALTNSIGFCFVKVSGPDDIEGISELYDMISGIVSDECCVVFRNDSCQLVDGYGVYADPYSDYYYDKVCVDEFSTTFYSRETMTPLRTFYGPFGYRFFAGTNLMAKNGLSSIQTQHESV